MGSETSNTDFENLNELFSFIDKHAKEDINALKLKYHGKPLPFNLDFALMQIALRKKGVSKFKGLFDDGKFLFPDFLSYEQASDISIARFHASLVGNGKMVLDMSAGLGIDSLEIARNKNYVTSIEIIKQKSDCVKYNASILGLGDRLDVINADSLEFGKTTDEKFDVLFIDPARRDDKNARTYSFSDCQPDIVSNFNILKKLSNHIIIKASPLLDITQTLRELKDTSKIYLLSKKGECKELLVEVTYGQTFEGVEVVELDNEGINWRTNFSPSELTMKDAPLISESLLNLYEYLYEPDASIMKLSCYGAICSKFNGLVKAAPNTNLYLSRELIADFPGRKLRITSIPQGSDLKKLKNQKFNVAVRNYPLSAQSLSKKLKVAEGDRNFIYGFRIFESQKPIICICEKI